MPSGSNRSRTLRSAESSRPASAVTASKTSSGDAARATRVATRRSAACSSANPRSSTRACALAIAVATSWVNPDSRASVSVGSDLSGAADPTVTTPHSRPSTVMGTATAERKPHSRAASAIGPEGWPE